MEEHWEAILAVNLLGILRVGLLGRTLGSNFSCKFTRYPKGWTLSEEHWEAILTVNLRGILRVGLFGSALESRFGSKFTQYPKSWTLWTSIGKPF